MPLHRLLKLAAALAVATGCASTPEPPIDVPDPRTTGIRVTPVFVDARGRMTAERAPDSDIVLEIAEGEATYYASKFDGRRAASGVVFRNSEAWAAHRTWPFGTVVRVTNQRNGRSAIVTIVDRGPHGTSERQRRTIIDLSQSTARELDFMAAGRVPVLVEVLEWGDGQRR